MVYFTLDLLPGRIHIVIKDNHELTLSAWWKWFNFYNRPCKSSKSLIPLYPIDESLAQAPSIDEVTKSLKCLNLHKAAGKTKILVQNISDLPFPSSPIFHIDNNILETVPNFCYLCRTLSSVPNLDQEISRHIAKASAIISSLKRGVWHNSNLSVRTKLTMYEATVFPALLYGAETWTACKGSRPTSPCLLPYGLPPSGTEDKLPIAHPWYNHTCNV